MHGLLPSRREIIRSDTTRLDFASPRINKRLAAVLKYLIQESAAGTAQSEVHELSKRLLRYGLGGLEKNWRARERWKRERREYELSPEILDAVERLVGKCGCVRLAFRRYGRTRDCPWRLSVIIRKQKALPQFLLRAVRLQPIKVCAFRGNSGRIYLNVAGKTLTIEKHAKAATKN